MTGRVIRLRVKQEALGMADGYAIVGKMPRRATGPIYGPDGEQVSTHRIPKPKRPDLWVVQTRSETLGWVEWTDDGLWSGERIDGMVRFHMTTKRDAVLWVVYRAGEA
jgi:hypothetical protein